MIPDISEWRGKPLPLALKLDTLEGVIALGLALAYARRGDVPATGVIREELWERLHSAPKGLAVAIREMALRMGDLRYRRSARKPVTPPSLEERFQEYIKRALRAAYASCGFRKCSQGHTTHVAVGSVASAICQTKRGGTYSRRCSFRKTTSDHRITVRRDWLRRVHREGISAANDCLILDATSELNIGSARVWSARWAQQGPGTSLVTVSGFIASVRGRMAKGNTASKAARAARSLAAIDDGFAADRLWRGWTTALRESA